MFTLCDIIWYTTSMGLLNGYDMMGAFDRYAQSGNFPDLTEYTRRSKNDE